MADTFHTIGVSDSSKVKLASSVDRMTSADQHQVSLQSSHLTEMLSRYVLISICANLKPLSDHHRVSFVKVYL